MARAPKLKVYRMPIGFHDAYVAAASQKAAAEAWGTDTSVFARKEAELVEDPALTKEPLSRPGEVIKRLRGTADEQIAALGADAPSKRAVKAAKARKPKPRPSRAALEEAEEAVAAAEARHREALKAIAEREAALAREREALEAEQRQERERLEARREKAEAAYDEAMRGWREG